MVGVREDVQVYGRISTELVLRGRAVTFDIIPSSNADARILRLIGLYASWDPGANDDTQAFWPAISELCATPPDVYAWQAIGDFNAMLGAHEHSSRAPLLGPSADSRADYVSFLAATNGRDLWSAVPDINPAKNGIQICRADGS